MKAQTPVRPRSALAFLLLLFGLAVPAWLVSDRLGVIGSLRIPVSDLGLAFAPMLVALGLLLVREGPSSAALLLARAFDPRTLRGGRWQAATMLIPPIVYLGSSRIMWLLGSDAPLPSPDALRLLALLGLFLLLAAGEEIGWMGYAFAPLQRRFGSLGASLVIAVPWWLGHLPSMAAIGASVGDMAWWSLGAIGLRIIMAWLYNGAGGCLFAVVLFHALLNLSRIATFPVEGAHYVGAYQAVGYVVVAMIAAIVVALTGGRLRESSRATIPLTHS
jgi:uncharacterized protein